MKLKLFLRFFEGEAVLYPESSLEYWSVKYNLRVREKTCASCKEIFRTTIPILIRGYAGLETPTHECGRQYNSAVFTPITEEAKNSWSQVF
ncbi:MAG: hypothetical protein A2504_09900 [Bdellovibrionales bacterium RIFOXYD12_FULL_39_22]|nr:MAG: hypothetical protein A2385_17535 [Bdellovibrionales bacterium RIFOXYB1_FULL_39_21]OFZ43923.1 MAG: hypothetical protein A2485_04205 [Bdellovibrionales bacterium RIFOXYC12_FULL_39_17]OFZ48295.1 MAG: hypothetical protein A2404_01620 [Bdellovibrionales bacterium RIFOXYC1_FULL_39_130]OFZ69514.1 MAG: hypothetical protein A2451_03950 [Bdellovibrionales bacterium RIFOXYC2_FULL_39_8]OFZ94886.1 MAG: hypothetical protein A2504_09900 [Bdellovibrionales bacterium RIFOXYD12_FULL_39_22]